MFAKVLSGKFCENDSRNRTKIGWAIKIKVHFHGKKNLNAEEATKL